MLEGRFRERLSVAECRRLIGAAGDRMTEDEVLCWRDQAYAFARCVIEGHRRGGSLPSVVPRDRSGVEERAAIHEFDAKMPPEDALRTAVRDYFAVPRLARRTH